MGAKRVKKRATERNISKKSEQIYKTQHKIYHFDTKKQENQEKKRDQNRETERRAEIAPARAGSSGKHFGNVENINYGQKIRRKKTTERAKKIKESRSSRGRKNVSTTVPKCSPNHS